MIKSSFLLIAMLCGSLVAWTSDAGGSAPGVVPVRDAGPGNVLVTLRKTVAAIDAGDRETLERAFTERLPDHLYGWPAVDGAEMGEVADRSLAFIGVGPDGVAWSASDRASALKAFAGLHQAGVRTTIVDARASCDSERASWVVATLERRDAGENPRVRRVQVTAVMEYVGGKLPFRIWHWQAVELPLQVREAAVESVPVREPR